jgi:hypothetical protein
MRCRKPRGNGDILNYLPYLPREARSAKQGRTGADGLGPVGKRNGETANRRRGERIQQERTELTEGTKLLHCDQSPVAIVNRISQFFLVPKLLFGNPIRETPFRAWTKQSFVGVRAQTEFGGVWERSR